MNARLIENLQSSEGSEVQRTHARKTAARWQREGPASTGGSVGEWGQEWEGREFLCREDVWGDRVGKCESLVLGWES